MGAAAAGMIKARRLIALLGLCATVVLQTPAQMRERLRQQKGPAVEAIRQFYHQHELRDPGATLSRYLWFGLVSGPAPAFQPILRRDELPPEVIALLGFSELLSSYYQEQKVGDLWRQVQPVYNREIQRLHEPLTQIVFTST